MASAVARDQDRREAYILKQLQSIEQWQGSVVHEVLATDLLTPRVLAAQSLRTDLLIRSARDLARRQFSFSESRRYREPGQTKTGAGTDYCALIDHERGQTVGQATLDGVDSTIVQCLTNLGKHSEIVRLIRGGSRHQTESMHHFRLAPGLPLGMAMLDLVFVSASGKTVIIDWKVTKGLGDYRQQMLVYALAVTRSTSWQSVGPDDVELYEVNLLKDDVRRHQITREMLDEAEDFVYGSLFELQALIDGRTYEDLDLNEFEIPEKPIICQYCTLEPLCTRLLIEAGRPEAAVVIQGRLF